MESANRRFDFSDCSVKKQHAFKLEPLAHEPLNRLFFKLIARLDVALQAVHIRCGAPQLHRGRASHAALRLMIGQPDGLAILVATW